MDTETEVFTHQKRTRRKWPRILAGIGVLLFVCLCLASIALVVLTDQTTLMGMSYLRAVNAGNDGAAMLMGDHYTGDQVAHQSILTLDIQRDISELQGMELSNVTATREQTLSGQWITDLRFEWRPTGSSGGWTSEELRVKTETWLIFTYIRTVEEAPQ